MNLKNEELKKYQKLAYHLAIYKTGNVDAAKDIASQTINLFLLKEDVIQNIEPWIVSSCYNYCNQFFKNKKNETLLKAKLRKNVIEMMSNQKAEKDIELYEAYQLTLIELSEEDIRIILFYHYCRQNAKKMAELTGESYSRLRKRIYRIKEKIKAETYKKLGVVASQKIISPQLNNLITKFLKSFKKNLEQKTLHKMYYYFSEVDLKTYNSDFEIYEIIDYRLNFNDNVYTVYVFFSTINKKVDSFFIKFYLNSKNYLKILVPPTKAKKLKIVDVNSPTGNQIQKLLKQYPEDRTGFSTIPEEELEKILKQV